MKREETIRMLRAVRVYCQPEHRPAVEQAIGELLRAKTAEGVGVDGLCAEKNSILTKTGNEAKE